jgi:nucleotide-binding universal stress UspA family protein
VRQAAELAGRIGARLEIVCAVEQGDDVDATLRDASAQAEGAGIDARTHARLGDPAEAILDVAEEQNADLIIVGHKGLTGAKRFLLGSVPERVSHHAPCSVLIIRTT